MNGKKYLARIDWLTANNRLLGIALGVMLAFNLMNWGAVKSCKESAQVTVVPVGGGAGMTVGNGKASEEYLRAMARYITSMAGNYTAGSYRDQMYELLVLFSPETVGEAQISFDRISTQIERYPSISSRMRWSSDEPLKYTEDMIQVQAKKDRLVSGKVSKTDNIFYCITYEVKHARFWLKGVREKTDEKTDPCFDSAADNKQPVNES